MGDKDSDMIFGKPELFFCEPDGEMKPLGKVIENSVRFAPEDAAELDRLSVREQMQFEPLRIKPQMFEGMFSITEIPAIMSFDEALEEHSCSLIIQSEPKINKPKKLKYPNKKRARRIWKKWKRRFGETPGKSIYLPKVKIESRIAKEKDSYLWYDVTAEPIKPINK